MQEPVAPEHRNSLRFTAKYAIFFHAAFTLDLNTEANETNENSSVTTKEEKKNHSLKPLELRTRFPAFCTMIYTSLKCIPMMYLQLYCLRDFEKHSNLNTKGT